MLGFQIKLKSSLQLVYHVTLVDYKKRKNTNYMPPKSLQKN